MRRERVRLSRRHQAWIYASLGALFVTGVVWLVVRNPFADDAGLDAGTSPLAPWSMKLHGAAAMITLVVLGTLLPGHVRRAWNARTARGTGATLLGFNALLIVTGYALYYAGGEDLRAIMSPLHWIAGLALAPTLGVHVWHARRRRPRKSRPRKPRAPRNGKDRRDVAIADGGPPVSLPDAGGRLHRSVLDS